MIKSAVCIALFILSVQFSLANKSDLEKGWNNFFNNKRKEAQANFEDALKSADSKAEGYLGLSLLAKEVDNSDEAFTQFANFFNASDNPLPYTYALWSTSCVNADFGSKSPQQLKFMEQLLVNPKANLTLKAMAAYILGKHYDNKGDFTKAAFYYKQIQSISQWKMAGTFENISASGFDKNYGPVHAKDYNETYKNKVGAPVSWIDLSGARVDQWVDFSYIFNYENSIMYAQTFINSPNQKDALLRIGTSGSLKVWLNDKLITSQADETNNDIDTYLIKVKLGKGANRLLLQVGESEGIGACNFLTRISTLDEKLFTDITYTKDIQSYSTADTSYKVEMFNNPYEEFFEKKIKEEPNTILNYILLAEAYSRNEKKHEMRTVLKKAREKSPNSGYISEQFVTLFIKTKNRTLLSKEVEWLKENDPQSSFSHKYQVQEAFDKENYDEAKTLIDKIEVEFGTSNKTNLQFLLNNRIKIAGQKDQVETIIKLVNEGYEKFPDSYNFVNLKAILEKAITKDSKKAVAIWEKYVKNVYSESAYLELASLYFDIAKVDKALKIYEMLIANEPLAVGYVYTLGEKYSGLQQYDKAIEYYLKCIKQTPYISTYWSSLGQAYEQQNKNDLAMSAYQKCLTYSPTSYHTREKLRHLEEKKDIFSHFDSVDVYQLIKNSPTLKDYPDDNSIILTNDIQKVVYGDGASETKETIVIKTLNKDGVDEWKEYGIGYNEYAQKLIIEKAEVVKPNGSKIAGERNGSNIVFTSLEPGDAIHITYRIQDFYSGMLSKHFWDKQYLSGFYPLKRVKYSLLVNKDVKFSFKMLNSDIKPSQKEVEDFILYTWETKDEPSIKWEKYMPALTDVAKVLYLSSIADWKFISEWYTDLSKTKAKAEYEVKEALDEMFMGKANLTQLQKAKMIYNYIVENVRYSSVSFRQSGHIPQKATTTLNTRLGDCKDVSTLFAAMCREVGMKASLMLVDTRDNGTNDMMLPSIDFNHCVAKVNADGKDYIIEMTSDKVPFSVVPDDLKKSFALEINPYGNQATNAPILINPSNRPQNNLLREATVTFDGGNMIVKKKNFRTGNYVSALKSTYQNLSKEERDKEMLETFSSDYPAKVKLNLLEFINLDSLEDTMKYKANFTVNDVFAKIGGMSICKIPWSDRIESIDFLSSDIRKLPIEYWKFVSCDKASETLTITIPQGKTISEMPKSQKFSCFLADYSIEYKLEGTKIIATRTIIYKNDFVPVEKYLELKQFYTNIVAADAEQIAFK